MSSLTGSLARNTYTAPSTNHASNTGSALLNLPQELIDEILRHFFVGTRHRANHTRPPSAVRQGKSGLSILRVSRLLSPSATKTFYSLSTFYHYLDLNRPFRMYCPSRDLTALIQFASFEIVLPSDGPVSYDGHNRVHRSTYQDICFATTLELFRDMSLPRKECRLVLPICESGGALAVFLRSPFFHALRHLRGFREVRLQIRDALCSARISTGRGMMAQRIRHRAWAMLFVLRPALEAALGASADGEWREFEEGGALRCEFEVVFRPYEAVAEGTVGDGGVDAGLYEVPPGPWPEDWSERYAELCRMYMEGAD